MSAPAPEVPNRRIVIALFLGVAFVLLWGLWSGDLLNTDDAIYAQMARESFASGEWVAFTWLGTPLFEKPPLLFWSLEISGGLFGFNTFAMRLPAAIAGFLSCVFLYRIVRRELGRLARLIAASAIADIVLAAAAVGLLVATFTFMWMSRRVMTDPLLTLATLAALDFALRLRASPGWRPAAGLGLAGGIGLLAKSIAIGPVALGLLPFILRRETWRYVLMACGIALLVAAPWYLMMSAEFGSEFWEVTLGYHVVSRASDAIVGSYDPLYYLNTFFGREGIMACVLLGGSLVGSWLALRDRSWSMGAVASVLWLSLLVIHLMQTQLYHYLMPTLPLMVILTLYAALPLLQLRVWSLTLAGAAAVGFLMGPAPQIFATKARSSYGELAAGPLSGLAPDTRLVLYNTYAPALFWTTGRRGEFWTDDANAHARLQSVDMLRRAKVVVRADRAGLNDVMRSAQGWVLVTPKSMRAALLNVLGVSADALASRYDVQEAFGHWIVKPRGDG